MIGVQTSVMLGSIIGRVQHDQNRQYYRSRKVLWRKNDDSMLYPANGSDYSLSCTIMAPEETVAEEATTETEVDTTDTEETADAEVDAEDSEEVEAFAENPN